jgi:Domain of unknown function (DUF4386)
MNLERRPARLAGFLYLLLTIAGVFTLIVVPGRTIVAGDATTTAAKILGSESLYRAGIAVSIFNSVLFLLLAVALYRLFMEVHATLAKLMVILVLVQVPLAIGDAMNQLAALLLLKGEPYLAVFDAAQKNALAMLFLHINGQGTIASELFWGLWLVPLAILVYRSGFLPRFLGVYLAVNALAYVALCAVGLLWPQHLAFANRYSFPALWGEPAFTVWLLVMGAKPRHPAPAMA